MTKESTKYFEENNSLFGIFRNRNEENKLNYHYLNEDRLRITKMERSVKNKDLDNNLLMDSTIAVGSVPCYLGAVALSVLNRNFILQILNEFNVIKCDVKNKITLGDLIKEFSGKNWKKKNYNLATHNCQNFAAEVIIVLKAVRINEEDKIRMNEKKALPNCLINALTDNEEICRINTLGRIPIFGCFFDIFAAKSLVEKNKKK